MTNSCVSCQLWLLIWLSSKKICWEPKVPKLKISYVWPETDLATSTSLKFLEVGAGIYKTTTMFLKCIPPPCRSIWSISLYKLLPPCSHFCTDHLSHVL
jgi:hypothetical protein